VVSAAATEELAAGGDVAGAPGIPRLIIAPGDEPVSARSDAAGSSVQVWRDEQGTRLASCHSVDGRRRVDVVGVGSFRFGALADTVTAHPWTSVPAKVIEETYYRSVLPVVLQARGTEVLHASAVHAGGVVAICGASGTGKSTLAFALSRRGHRLWADDALAIGLRGPSPVAFPVPFEIRLRPRAVTFFGLGRQTAVAASAPGPREPADQSEAPLAAVLVLSRYDEKARDRSVQVERLRPTAALTALLAHAYCFSLEDPDLKRRMVERYMALAARVPVFALRFRPGFELLPGVLDQVEWVARTSP
jgi:hypothetical protein